ncbi:UNVERIFIED_CONTAM: hypothetical protein GTU68_044556 [Idotea baltica]|nr:hypothetical protein [Idotea baltica]
MSSGKSTIGKKLSKKLKLDFVDLDQWISDSEGKSIAQLFEEHGEKAFREMESSYLQEIATFPNAVIALGGGTPCSKANLELIKANGKVVYLNAAQAMLINRLSENPNNRPLVAGLSKSAISKKVKEMLADRSKYYTKADVTVDISKRTKVNELISELATQLK